MIQLPTETLQAANMRGELKRWGQAATSFLGALNEWRPHDAKDVWTYSRAKTVEEARKECNVSDNVREDAVLAMMGWDFDLIDKTHQTFTGNRRPWMKPEFLAFGKHGFEVSDKAHEYIREACTPVFTGDVTSEPMASLLAVSEGIARLIDQGVILGPQESQLRRAFTIKGKDIFPSLMQAQTTPLAQVPKSKRKAIMKPGKIAPHGSTK